MSTLFEQVRQAIAQAQKSGMSLDELSGYAGLSRQTLHNWLDGKVYEPRRKKLDQVASALGKKVVVENGQLRLR